MNDPQVLFLQTIREKYFVQPVLKRSEKLAFITYKLSLFQDNRVSSVLPF